MLTPIKNIYCIDINWIDKQILEIEKDLKYVFNTYDEKVKLNTDLGKLLKMKLKLKPIQPLIEDAFDDSRKQHTWAGGRLYGEDEEQDLTDFLNPNKEKYINTKQFEIN